MSDSANHPKQRRPHHRSRPHQSRGLDPVLTRKPGLSHPGSLILAAGGIVFVAYVFDVVGTKVFLDSFFSGLDQSAKAKNEIVSKIFLAALPFLGLALAAFIGFLLWNALGLGTGRRKRKKKLQSREEVSLDDFAHAASVHGISSKVARETYRILLPRYEQKMRVNLRDKLADDLRMRPNEISELFGNLLRHGDRLRSVSSATAPMHTILDLMLAIETCDPRSLTRSKMYLRKTPLQTAETIESAPLAAEPAAAALVAEGPAARAKAAAAARHAAMTKPGFV